MVKQTKQQIIALCTRHGKHFDGKSNWTKRHFSWLRALELGEPILQETLTEFISTLDTLMEKVERMDKRIEELAEKKAYAGQVKPLECLKGIATHTALALVVEVGDFYRFLSAERFASFLSMANKNCKKTANKFCSFSAGVR